MDEMESSRPRGSDVDAQAALESWLKVSRALVDDLPLTETLDVIAQVARDLTGNKCAMVALADERAERLIVQGAAGLTPEYLAITNELNPLMVGDARGRLETPSARAFRTGEPVAVLDMFADDDFVDWRQAAASQGYRSMLSMPLAGPGELGALTVYAESPGEFQQTEIDLLSALAKGAAAAIEIVRLRGRELAMMAELEEVDTMHQRLNRVALAGRGLDHILHSLSEMTGYGMYVEDAAGEKAIAAWPPGHSGPDLPDVERRTMRDEACEHLQMGSWSPADGDRTVYVAPVVLAGEVVATLWGSGPQRPMAPTQRRIFERGAMVGALELLKQRHVQEVEWRMRGDLFRDLVNVEPAGVPRIVERAHSYGHDLTCAHVVLVVHPDAPPVATRSSVPTSEAALQHVISCTRSIAAGRPGSWLVAAHEGAAVMLMPQSHEDTESPPKIAKAIVSLVASRSGGSITASVSIGDSCTSPLDYRSATHVASMAIRLTQNAGGSGRVVNVEELGIFRLMLSTHDASMLSEFAERTLAPLRQQQDTRNADLVQTLESFIENDLQPGRTATALHVHPNTLTYRLRRIEVLTGVALRSSQGLLDFSFALAIDRLTRLS